MGVDWNADPTVTVKMGWLGVGLPHLMMYVMAVMFAIWVIVLLKGLSIRREWRKLVKL